MFRNVILTTLLWMTLAAPVQAQDSAAAARHYSTAIASAERGDIPAAISEMRAALALDSTIPNAYWNLGLWYADLGQPQDALRMWMSYRALIPDDWHARAKIIQAYQALGDLPSVARERDSLFALRASGRDTVLAEREEYVRDQFRLDTLRLMGLETFEPSGPRQVFYTFHVLDKDGRSAYRFSLGSYDLTTEVARSSKQIGPQERLYHLDGYDEDSHSTFGFFKDKPDYYATKDLVIKAISRNLEPVSRSERGRR